MHALGSDEFLKKATKLLARLHARLHRYSIHHGLICYSSDYKDTPYIVVSQDGDLKYRILYEAHDNAISVHLAREKTYVSVSSDYCYTNL